MDCNYTTIKTCELKGSTFRSHLLNFGDFDISEYTFSAGFSNGLGQKLNDVDLVKVGNSVILPLTSIENRSGRFRSDVWMVTEGSKDLAVRFDISISDTDCGCTDDTTHDITITFQELVIPVTVTQSVVNINLDYDSLTPEQILELQQPAIDAGNEVRQQVDEYIDAKELQINSVINEANEATQSANTATGNADEKATAAQTAANNANEAKTAAEAATQEANNATSAANTATTNANNATTAANTAAGNAQNEADAAQQINNAVQLAENTRISNENTRVNQESTRQTNETGRVTAEVNRVSAESLRVSAESARATATATAIANANAAAATANNAKGWQPLLVADTTTITGKTLLKLQDWIGGTGTKPTNHVGQWQKADGTYTSVASEAIDFTATFATRIASLENIVQNNTWYGVEWDLTVTNPVMTRIGNTALHQSLPIQSKMRRCLLQDDGTVKYYLDANDSTKKADGTAANLTGTDGQVMVEIPKHYRRFDTDGNKVRCLISENQLPDFHEVPLMYVSAYQATVDRTTATPKLASVVNLTANFRGGNNNAAWDAETRSLLGKPASLISLTNFRTYARNRGAAGKNGAGWNCYLYEAHKALFWLYVVEYANRNSQAVFNASLDANGYPQGGLGNGVADLIFAKWNTFNASNPFVPMGHTNALGNKTGVVPFTMPSEYDPALFTTNVPSYRGVENPFGHIWHWMDGVKVQIQAADAGGRSIFYTSLNPALFSDSGYTNYRESGDIMRDNGYLKRMVIGEFGEIVPGESGAGATTYWCDYGYHGTIPASGVSLRGFQLGGCADYAGYAGLGCSFSNYGPSGAYPNIGSRLCFLP